MVSIGNLTTGGTGKTPAVHMLAKWARDEGFRAAVLSRGYGGSHRKGVLEVSDGDTILAGPREAGDEPYLLARKLRGVPVVISKDRYMAGLLAQQKHGTNFFILDDGFQHLALKRDLDLVLLDASNPFGNGHLLPWGPLREPKDHLERADAFIITRSQGKTGKGLLDILEAGFPDKPIFWSEHRPESVVLPGDDRVGPDFLEGKRVIAFAGIARPQFFKETLARLGAEMLSYRPFRDHYAFSHRDIQDLVHQKETMKADLLITTEKDWVRIQGMMPESSHIAYLTISFQLSSSFRDFFFKSLKKSS